MNAPSSGPTLVFWRKGKRRCELWMASGAPELRIFDGNTLRYKERAPLEALHARAAQLGELRQS